MLNGRGGTILMRISTFLHSGASIALQTVTFRDGHIWLQIPVNALSGAHGLSNSHGHGSASRGAAVSSALTRNCEVLAWPSWRRLSVKEARSYPWPTKT